MAKNPAGPAPAFQINTTGWQRQGNDQGVQNYGATGQVWDNPQNDPNFWTKRPAVAAQNQEYYGGTTQSAGDSSESQQGAFESTSDSSRKRKYKGYDEQYGMSDWDNDHWKQDGRARYQQTGYNPAQGSGAFENWKNSYLDSDHEDYQGDDRKTEFQDRWAYYNRWNNNKYSDYMS